MEECEDASDDHDDEEPVLGPSGAPSGPSTAPPEPAPSGPRPAPEAVTCTGDGVGMGQPSEGVTECSRTFTQCSDGNTYSHSCVIPAEGDAECRCLVNDEAVLTYSVASSNPCAIDPLARCGWDLRL